MILIAKSIRKGDHKKMKKQEMNVFTMYEGWDAEKEKQKRNTLVGKTMLAGMEKSTEFHEKREACIRKKYNPVKEKVLFWYYRLATGVWHTAGLRADRTILLAGRKKKNIFDSTEWTNIRCPVYT